MAKDGETHMYEGRRVAIRYCGSMNFQACDDQDDKSRHLFSVIDFNTQGCRLKSSHSIHKSYSPDSVIELKFQIADIGEDGNPFRGKKVLGRIADTSPDKKEFSVVFTRPLRLELVGKFGAFFIKPKTISPAERRYFYDQQEKLALLDIQELQAATRDNVSRMFQLQTFTIPAVAGLLVTGALLNFEPSIVSGTSIPAALANALSVLLPLFCAIVSSIAFLIYTQKLNRIRERIAFCALLQRYIAMSAFPPCYRGWHDAQLNMRQLELRGANRDIYVDPPPIKESWGINRQVPFTKDPFSAAGIFALITLPLASVTLSGIGIWNAIADSDSSIDIYKIIFACTITLGTLSLFTVLLFRELQVQKGTRSTRHIMLRYSELLKCVPPYDPLNTGPLCFTHVDH